MELAARQKCHLSEILLFLRATARRRSVPAMLLRLLVPKPVLFQRALEEEALADPTTRYVMGSQSLLFTSP
jgi:hypothetical protein